MAVVTEPGDVRTASLLDLDPEFAEQVPSEDLAAARRAAAVNTLSLGGGDGEALTKLGQRPQVTGFLVLDGLLLREVCVYDRALSELLGPGDVIEPTVRAQGFLPVRTELRTLAPTRVAVLGPAFARACGQWPGLLGLLERRKAESRQRVATHGALTQLPRVDLRLLAILWHFAAVWGRVTPEGTAVPFELTHEMLGRLVGAQRPTVTLALKDLAEARLLERADDGSWLLHNGSLEHLETVLGADAGAPSALGRARQVRRQSAERQAESQALRAEATQAHRRLDQLRQPPGDAA